MFVLATMYHHSNRTVTKAMSYTETPFFEGDRRESKGGKESLICRTLGTEKNMVSIM